MKTVTEILDENPLISIIIPMYNTLNVIDETLKTVYAQSYVDWEIILVDDCSSDGSYEYAKKLAEKEKRIKVYKLAKNSGPGAATKFGFSKASGGFAAFLDSDDLWTPDKLKVQIEYMKRNNYLFSCTDYEQIDENGNSLGRIMSCKDCATYKTVLNSCPIGSSTVIISSELLGMVSIPDIRKCNDYTLWLRLLRLYPCVYGLHENLMKYRIWSQSISYNKFKKIKYFWKSWREYEHLSVPYSIVLLIRWTLNKLMKIK